MRYITIKKLNKHQINDLYVLYQNEWWTAKRTRKEIKTMLRHTDIIIGIINKKGKLIGFARVLTDRIYKAEIYDVIVHPKYRDKGLGRVLMDAILQHKKLRKVQQFNLQCLPEMVGYYEQWGFAGQGNLIYMRYSR
jgi:predicted GNAT family N-acyltransferase